MIHQIKSQLQKKSSHINRTILSTHPIISQQKNTISFYILKQSEQSQLQVIKNIQQYIEHTKKNFFLPFSQTYVKDIIVHFSDGLQIKDVQFNNDTQICYEITAKQSTLNIIKEYLANTDSSVKCEIIDRDTKNIYTSRSVKETVAQRYLKVILEGAETQKYLLDHIQLIKQFEDNQIQVKRTFKKNQKIQSEIIMLTFYSGIPEREYIQLHYSSQQKANRMFLLLQYLFQKQSQQYQLQLEIYKNKLLLNSKAQHPKMQGLKLKVKKSQLSKNILQLHCSQVLYDSKQIFEQLRRMSRTQNFNEIFKFEFPKYINNFLKPIQPESLFTDRQWIQRILQMITDIKWEIDDLEITIQGKYNPSGLVKPQQHLRKGIQQEQQTKQMSTTNHRVNMVAIIPTKQNGLYEKLKKSYDKKAGILGFGKVYVQKYYCDSFTVDKNLFQALQEIYFYSIQKLNNSSPNLVFSDNFHNEKLGDRVTITAHSSQKSDLAKPLTIIKNIFIPKKLSIKRLEIKFLGETVQGQEIINKLQEEYQLCHLQLKSQQNLIEIYCNQSDYRPISCQLIKNHLPNNFSNFVISYKGLNLHKIIELFKNLKQTQQFIFFFQISYQSRNITIWSEKRVHAQIKNKIEQIPLQLKDGKQCQICFSTMATPYKLINCGCTFCWNCIATHVESTKDTSLTAIYCPNEECRDKRNFVNINDVKYLVSEKVFKNLCRLKTKKYASQYQEKYYICGYCDYFFSKDKIIGRTVFCEGCQIQFCLKCMQSHHNFTCKQYDSGDYILKLGMKRCPKCRQGIQKNEGCNHVECIRCKAHICWNCLKYFPNSKQCYDHLAKQCGGIYGPNQRR